MFKSLALRVNSLLESSGCSDLSVISCGASLAYYGLLGKVFGVWLTDVDLTSVPDEHLTSLVSSIQDRLCITNISGRNLVSILDSNKSDWLIIKNQSLDTEETGALLQAMETSLGRLELFGDVTLDMETLLRYDGQGKCQRIAFIDETATRYRKSLTTWAKRTDWEVRVIDEIRPWLEVHSNHVAWSPTPTHQ